MSPGVYWTFSLERMWVLCASSGDLTTSSLLSPGPSTLTPEKLGVIRDLRRPR